jgi:VIT1/CCC1 family predicted Fe2+/Mn2+ transporter/rubrerythrin
MPAQTDDTTAAGRAEAVERLKQAWRGEIQARMVYEILAAREGDPRRAGIIRQIAEAESTHRHKVEQRLRELGEPVPDAAGVGLSGWMRLQARLAPTVRVLAAMEAREDDEVNDRYRRPTGDAGTDAVLETIRTDEAEHSRDLQALMAEKAGQPPPTPAQNRLHKILGREKWHRTGAGWISGAIYGANDGLAAVFGIVAGVSGATGGSGFVLTAGLSGAVASALSMATGAYLAEKSEAEVVAANVAREREEISERPEEEREEASLFYQLKGLDKKDADMLAEKLSADPEALLKVLAQEELGGAEAPGNAVQSALAAGISTFLGAMIPVIPFFFMKGLAAVVVAFVVSLIAHFLVGASKALFTLRTWYAAGLEMTLAGVIVGGITYGLGLLLQGHGA